MFSRKTNHDYISPLCLQSISVLKLKELSVIGKHMCQLLLNTTCYGSDRNLITLTHLSRFTHPQEIFRHSANLLFLSNGYNSWNRLNTLNAKCIEYLIAFSYKLGSCGIQILEYHRNIYITIKAIWHTFKLPVFVATRLTCYPFGGSLNGSNTDNQSSSHLKNMKNSKFNISILEYNL